MVCNVVVFIPQPKVGKRRQQELDNPFVCSLIKRSCGHPGETGKISSGGETGTLRHFSLLHDGGIFFCTLASNLFLSYTAPVTVTAGQPQNLYVLVLTRKGSCRYTESQEIRVFLRPPQPLFKGWVRGRANKKTNSAAIAQSSISAVRSILAIFMWHTRLFQISPRFS